MDNDRSFLNFQLSIFNCLDLVDLNFRKALTVALFAFVLLAAFFLKDDDLVRFAVGNDSCVDRGTAANLGVFSFADKKSVDRDLSAGLFIDGRYAKRLAALYRKLLSACFDNCVTHYCVSS